MQDLKNVLFLFEIMLLYLFLLCVGLLLWGSFCRNVHPGVDEAFVKKQSKAQVAAPMFSFATGRGPVSHPQRLGACQTKLRNVSPFTEMTVEAVSRDFVFLVHKMV